MFVRVFGIFAALAVLRAPLGHATEPDADVIPMQPRTYPLELTGRITKPTCMDIPADLSLCQGIGYQQMRMPNLLDHDSMEEVRFQAQSWVPLLLQRCHDDTQLFLCTLFAPVCLDRPIYPCRSLCEEVRTGCEPIMEQNCFPWPDMLSCEKFPPDNDLCIKSEMREQNGTETEEDFQISPELHEQYMTLFTQCHDDSSQLTLLRKFCVSDFVLKMKIKAIRESKDGKKYIGDTHPAKFEILKQGSLKNKDLKRLIFYVREGANCRCSMLENSRNYLLVMGHRDRSQPRKLFMTFVHSWEKTRDFRRAVKSFEDPDACPNLEEQAMAAEVVGRAPSRGNSGRRDRTETQPESVDTEQTAQRPTAEQTGTPVQERVPITEQRMADETPPTPVRKPGSKRDRTRRTRRRQSRNRQEAETTGNNRPTSG